MKTASCLTKSMSSLPRTLVAWVMMSCAAAWAQEVKVRVSLSEKEAVWAGQRVTLAVELLAPGFFTGAPAFDLPEVPGLLLAPPEGSPTVSSETADDGTAYTVQRHEVSVFSRRGGNQVVPPFTVRFSYKRQPLDKDVVAASVKTEPVNFTVKVPPGAEKLGGVISARGLTVTEEWKPDPGKPGTKAGDAFTRTITFTAPDVPAMAFPPFPAGKIDGIGIYQKDPEVLDRDDRGSLTGERRDTVTYVCQRPGEFTIPAVRVTWFDLEGETLRTIDFPEHKLAVAANPAMAQHAAAGEKVKDDRVIWKTAGVVAALGLSGWLAFLFRKKVRAALARWVKPWRAVRLQPLNSGDHAE